MLFPHRLKDSSDHGVTLDFFESLLRKDSPCRLEDEYPLVFRPEFHERVFVKKMGSEIVAGLGILPREVEIDEGRTARGLFVGSVVTDPKQRLQGYQRELFLAVTEHAENHGFDFIVLWSSQIQFYEKLGFFLGGLQATWTPTLKQSLATLEKGVVVDESRNVEFSHKFFEAFDRKSFCVKRTAEEMRLLWRIPQMRVAYTKNAYALLGKGEDFKHVCHEWAGPTDEVLACLEALRTVEPNLRILSPGVIHLEEERGVVNALEQSSFECRLEYLGLIKIIGSGFDKKDFDPSQLKYPFFIWGLDSI